MSILRNSIIVLVAVLALTPSAYAGACSSGPFHVCKPFSVSGVWYSDATKTTVVGGWWSTCPDVTTCLKSQGNWGQQTQYSTVSCEPCAPCGNCPISHQEGEPGEDAILLAELEALEAAEQQADECDL